MLCEDPIIAALHHLILQDRLVRLAKTQRETSDNDNSFHAGRHHVLQKNLRQRRCTLAHNAQYPRIAEPGGRYEVLLVCESLR